MSEFHDEFPQYEMLAHHSEEEGKIKRKKLWQVFWIMLAITVAELIIGIYASQLGLLNDHRRSTISLKVIFITLTLVKAAFIVMQFMHLGHENKLSKWVILAPYSVFIVYLVLMGTVGEGNYSKTGRTEMNHLISEQALEAQTGGGHHEATGAEEHHAEEGAKEQHHE